MLGNEQYGRLAIEIGAEATRNPAIAEVFGRNESELRGALIEALDRGQKRGVVDPALDIHAAVFLIMALFDGIPGRSIFAQDISSGRVAKTLERILRKILGRT
ncbi:MAG: TetR family transcriptional regulator C-terminal domain-containing protein [Sneathiella sp.]|nr:TetR family transcriptional regulator C-terminal domain-containing protein [Sneathiella sp.]